MLTIANTVVVTRSSPPMLAIIFWILLLLWAIGVFAPFPDAYRAYAERGRGIVALILFAILGYYAPGSPMN